MAFGDLKGTFGVALNSALTSNVATGSATSVVAGDLVYAVFAQQTALTVSLVTDNLGHTYTASSVGTDAGSISGRAFYTRVTASGSLTSLTGTATASTQNVAFIAAAFAGPFAVPPIDANPAEITAGSAGTSYTCPATGDRVQAVELVVGWIARGAGTAFTATSPNTVAVQLATQTVGNAVIGYQTTVTSSSFSPVFTSATTAGVRVLGVNSFLNAFDTRTVRPITRYEWRRPTSAAHGPFDYRNIAVLQPAVAADLPPGKQFMELPPQPPRVRCVSLLTHTDSFKLPLQQVLPPLAEDFPVPRDQRRNLAHWQDYILPWAQAPPETVNPGFNQWFNPWGPLRGRQDWILATPISLTAVVTATFQIAQYDWPVPRGVPRNLQGWTDSFKLPLQQVLPPHQTDWPLPTPTARRNPQDWIAASNPASIPAPLQTNPGFNQWFNPWGPRRGPQDWIQAPSLALTFVTTPPPIAQYDWPVPRGPRRNPQDWSDSFKLPLQQVLPPRQTDWPVPRGPRRGVQDWIAPTNIALVTAVVGTPFVQKDWPVPRGPHSNILRGFTDALYVDILPPPANYDWPLTPARRRNRQDWILASSIALTAAPVVPPPIAQDDWPLPRGARRGPQDWVLPSSIALTTAPLILPQNSQTDWPNPSIARRNPQDWIYTLNPPTPPPPPVGLPLMGQIWME